jgi:hypothetical protein
MAVQVRTQHQSVPQAFQGLKTIDQEIGFYSSFPSAASGKSLVLFIITLGIYFFTQMTIFEFRKRIRVLKNAEYQIRRSGA